jgi:hypothetical protein
MRVARPTSVVNAGQTRGELDTSSGVRRLCVGQAGVRDLRVRERRIDSSVLHSGVD